MKLSVYILVCSGVVLALLSHASCEESSEYKDVEITHPRFKKSLEEPQYAESLQPHNILVRKSETGDYVALLQKVLSKALDLARNLQVFLVEKLKTIMSKLN